MSPYAQEACCTVISAQLAHFLSPSVVTIYCKHSSEESESIILFLLESDLTKHSTVRRIKQTLNNLVLFVHYFILDGIVTVVSLF